MTCGLRVSSSSAAECCAAFIAPVWPPQTAPSPLSSGEIDGGSQAALDSPGAQYRRRKQLEQEQQATMRHDADVDGARTSSERSSGDGSAHGGFASADGAGAAAVSGSPAVPVPASQAGAGQLLRVRGGSDGSSPPTPQHLPARGRGPLAIGSGDGTRAMALAARFDNIVAGSRAHHHQGWPSGPRDSPDATPRSPSPLRYAAV